MERQVVEDNALKDFGKKTEKRDRTIIGKGAESLNLRKRNDRGALLRGGKRRGI